VLVPSVSPVSIAPEVDITPVELPGSPVPAETLLVMLVVVPAPDVPPVLLTAPVVPELEVLPSVAVAPSVPCVALNPDPPSLSAQPASNKTYSVVRGTLPMVRRMYPQ
jgi:hypothetical protein